MSDAAGRAGPPLRVLYITQWFEPEPAFKGAAFAAALAARGMRVQVLTGFPNYPGGRLYPGYRVLPIKRDTWAGLPIDRVALWPSHDRSSIGRMANYVSFFFSVLIYCLVHVGRYDVVYVYHPPITPALAALFAGRLHKVPVVLDVQDLWPDSVAASGMGHPIIARLLGWVCRKVHAGVAHIVCQSEGIARALVERGVPETRLRTIYNWSNYAPAEPSKLPSTNSSDRILKPDRINVVYGGNLGSAQQVECLVEAVRRARERVPELQLHVFGNGIDQSRVVDAALTSGGGALVHGRIGREDMDRIFERADIVALHLRDDPLFAITIPSKLQHYLSVGKPIVAGLTGEAARLLEQSGAAAVAAPGDIDDLADKLVGLALMDSAQRAEIGEAGKAFYRERLSFTQAITQTEKLLWQHGRGERR